MSKVARMKISLIGLLAVTQGVFCAESSPTAEELSVLVSGVFEVQLSPQEDESAPAGRVIISKQYSGALRGSGIGQMLSKRTETGRAIYYAVEEFEGSLDGLVGGFTLLHQGVMSSEESSLLITILEGSGKGRLAAISGAMQIEQEDDVHRYILTYTLN